MQRYLAPLTVLALIVFIGVLAGPAPAAETPRRGGVLLAVIGADPPSLDPHQEQHLRHLQLVAPLYSTLLQIDPYDYPKIIGDVATEWKISPDGLTYTFKIRPGHQVPRRIAADGGRRQGHLRQDRLPAGRGPQHAEAATTRRSSASRPPTRARWCSSSSSPRPPS